MPSVSSPVKSRICMDRLSQPQHQSGLIDAFPRQPMKRRPRPGMRAFGRPMLDRIEVDVLQVSLQVILVADDMLPESPLPDATTAVPPARVADVAFPSAGGDPCP